VHSSLPLPGINLLEEQSERRGSFLISAASTRPIGNSGLSRTTPHPSSLSAKAHPSWP